MMKHRTREAVASQGSHWLAQALLLARMEMLPDGTPRDFSPRRAIVAAIIRAELHRRGIATR